MSYKPTLCLDFDGVIHSYTSGWQGADVVADGPVPGAIDFLFIAVKHFNVAIYSSRSHQEGGIKAMQDWLIAEVRPIFFRSFYPDPREAPDIVESFVMEELKWPQEKPPAHLTLDDRAWCFEGTFPSIEAIKEFKPWNK